MKKTRLVSSLLPHRSPGFAAGRRALICAAMVCLLLPLKGRAEEQGQAPAAGASSRPALPVATNQVPFQPTRYPRVKVRHVPQPAPAPALLQAARQGRRNPGIELPGPKGGTLIRVDETHQIPEFAPPLPAKRPHPTTNTTTTGAGAKLAQTVAN